MTALPSRWTCLSVDVEGYGRRDSVEHADLQRELISLLDTAATAAGFDRRQWTRQGQGDGELSLIPGSEPVARLVGAFVDELDAELYRRNGSGDLERRIRMRMALDEGYVDPAAANGFAGQAVVGVSRLVDAEPLRSALVAVPAANLAVLVSRRVYEDLIASGLSGVDTARWRRLAVVKKEYREDAWLRVPRTSVHEIPLEPAAGKATPEPAQTVINIGKVTKSHVGPRY
jgi:hypothetical protein